MGSGVLDIFNFFRKKEEKKEEVPEKKGRIVLQVTDSDGKVEYYNDVETACVILKLNAMAVNNCLKGCQSKHKGYSFKEVEI